MLCSTLLSLASPFYEDPFVNDQQSFLDRISDKIDGAPISFSFKKFLKSVLMCSDNHQLPTFAELKTEYLKSGGTMFSHEDLSITTQPRSDYKSFNFRAISDFLEKLISSSQSRLEFYCDQDFFDLQVHQNEILKKSILNIQILDFDKNEFNSNWNSLANSLSANLINNFGVNKNDYDARAVSHQKENENPYASKTFHQTKGKKNEPMESSSSKKETMNGPQIPSKSQFANYKSFEIHDAGEVRLSEQNVKGHGSNAKHEAKNISHHSKDVTENIKETTNPNILNNTSLTEMIKKFACTNSYSESGKDTMNNINEVGTSSKQHTVSLQNMINDLKAHTANQMNNDKEKTTPGMEGQLNGLINLLQSNQVPPNVLKMICDDLFFKQRAEGNVFYMPGSNSNIGTSQTDNNKLNKTQDSSKLELVDLDMQLDGNRSSCNRRLTFQTDNKNHNRTFSPIPRNDFESTPVKLRPSMSGESSMSKTFDNGRFVSFAPNANKDPQSDSKKDGPLFATKYSHSQSNSVENINDDEMGKSLKLQRRPSFVKNHLTIDTEPIQVSETKDSIAKKNKDHQKLLEFENQILTHIQLSPKISVYKTISMNELKNLDTKEKVVSLNPGESESKITTFNNLNAGLSSEIQSRRNVQCHSEFNALSPGKKTEKSSQSSQKQRIVQEQTNELSKCGIVNGNQNIGHRENDLKVGNYANYSVTNQHRVNNDFKQIDSQFPIKYQHDEFSTERVQISHLVNTTHTPLHEPHIPTVNNQNPEYFMVQPPRSPVSRRVVIETPGVRSIINENYTTVTDDVSKVSTIRNVSPMRITKVIRRSYTITPDKKIIEHEIPKDNVIEEIIFNDSGSHEVTTDMNSHARRSHMGIDQAYKVSARTPNHYDIPNVTKTSFIYESPNKGVAISQMNTKYSYERESDRIRVVRDENFGLPSKTMYQQSQLPIAKNSERVDTFDTHSHYSTNENLDKSPSFLTRPQLGHNKPLGNISQYLANEFRGQKQTNNATTTREAQTSNQGRVHRSDLERFYNGERINPIYPISNQLHSPRNADYFNTLLSTFESFSSVQPINRSTSRANICQTNSTLRQSKATPHPMHYNQGYSSRQVNRVSPQRSSFINEYQSNDYRSMPYGRSRSPVRISTVCTKDGYRSPKAAFKDSSNYFPTQVDGVYTTDPNSPIRSRDRTSQFCSLKTSMNVPSRHY